MEDICRNLGISNDTFHNWRSKHDGLEVNEAKAWMSRTAYRSQAKPKGGRVLRERMKASAAGHTHYR